VKEEAPKAPEAPKEIDKEELQKRLRREKLARWKAEQAAAATEGEPAADADGNVASAPESGVEQAAPMSGGTEAEKKMAEIAASLAKRHGVGEGDEDEKRGDAEEKEDAAQGEDKMEEDEAGEGEVAKKGNVRKRRQIAEEDYFDADDDEEDEEEAAIEGGDGAGDGGEEEEEDPLDAFMKGVSKEVKKLDKADEKRAVQTVDMDSILKTNKALAAGKKMKIKIGALGQRMEQEDSIPDQEELDKQEDEFDINEWNDRKNQAKQLRPVRESRLKPET